MSDALRVAVRVRPFIHEYEKVDGVRNIIKMDRTTQQTTITNPESGADKVFTFDFSYDSFVPEDDPNHASQDTVWEDLGVDVLDNAWKGFNVSLFAYGQTGAGKSHSMMGYPGQEGIVPRACKKIFERIRDNPEEGTTFKVEASMLEIYNEKVRDLFNPSSGGGRGLKVRDHPKTGPYVQNLTKSAVGSYEEIAQAMDAGTRARTVAATAMNATSSRAHTIFQVVVTQTTVDQAAGKAMDKVSTISLIDLAGSERADRTGASGDRLKEGCAINQSLSALGNVIFALAERTTNPKKNTLVPYRDSVLTHLLKNSLGGNAKTVMIAAISPSCVNYDETLSTLRYADRAKQIKNKAVVNEDPNQKLIRGLKEEIEQLRSLLAAGTDMPRPGTAEVRRIEEAVTENERLIRESERSWEDRLKETQSNVQQRDAAFAKLGMNLDESKIATTPHLVNLNQDPQMSGVLTYFLEEGLTRVGRDDANTPQNIVLSGLSILKEHCKLARVQETVTVEALQGAKVFVNGALVDHGEAHPLVHRDRIVFGNNHVFLCLVPSSHPNGPFSKDKRSLMITENSWDQAMGELNQSKLSSLTEDERQAKEKAEAEAREMQAKVRELESKMAEERKRAEEKARAATDAEREAMLEKQKELQLKLQEQIDRTNLEQARKDRERRKRAVLEEEILRTLPLVSEANAISEELEKKMEFALQLVATQHQQQREEHETSVDAENIASKLETTVWIRVQTQGLEVPVMWTLDKFVNRLYLMREMYEDFVDSGRNMEEVAEIYGQEYDPFYDPPEEQLIGKSYIVLAPLDFFINIDDSAPIIQYQGKTDGALEVAITLDEAQVDNLDLYDTEEEKTMKDFFGTSLKFSISVRSAKGLPKNLSNKVAVSYKFFTETFRTPSCSKATINPRFDHVDRVTIPLTKEFVDYVQKEPLEFQVWGQIEEVVESKQGGHVATRKGKARASKTVQFEQDRSGGDMDTVETKAVDLSDTVPQRGLEEPDEAPPQHESGSSNLHQELQRVQDTLEAVSAEKEKLESQVKSLKTQLEEKTQALEAIEQEKRLLAPPELHASSAGETRSAACQLM